MSGRIGFLVLCAFLSIGGGESAKAASAPLPSDRTLCDRSHWLCQPPVAASWIPSSDARAELPPGYVSFCLRFADQCVFDKNQPSVVTLNAAEWDVLQQVNSWVNGAIRPMDDLTHYGRAEYWTIPSDGLGDCDDYALTKRRDLIQRGFPAAALRIAVVITPDGERHAVLTVATDHGDFVLDNLTDELGPWNARGFRWIARQDAGDPWRWDSLETSDHPSLLVVAATLPGKR